MSDITRANSMEVTTVRTLLSWRKTQLTEPADYFPLANQMVRWSQYWNKNCNRQTINNIQGTLYLPTSLWPIEPTVNHEIYLNKIYMVFYQHADNLISDRHWWYDVVFRIGMSWKHFGEDRQQLAGRMECSVFSKSGTPDFWVRENSK